MRSAWHIPQGTATPQGLLAVDHATPHKKHKTRDATTRGAATQGAAESGASTARYVAKRSASMYGGVAILMLSLIGGVHGARRPAPL